MKIELTSEELEMLEAKAKRDASKTLVEEAFGSSTDYADIKEYCEEALSKNENLTSSNISIEVETDDWGLFKNNCQLLQKRSMERFI